MIKISPLIILIFVQACKPNQTRIHNTMGHGMPLKRYMDNEALLASTKVKPLHSFVRGTDMACIS